MGIELAPDKHPVSNWGSVKHVANPWRDHTTGVSLCDTITNFPSGLKQAMFAAVSTRIIRRKTWNGCALNAAGMEVGKEGSVSSIEVAAKTFGITQAAVKQFINIWDALPGTDEMANATLRDCIEKAGLFVEPGQKMPRIIRVKVYEDQQKKLREQFDSLMEANMIDGTDVMEQLLTSV